MRELTLIEVETLLKEGVAYAQSLGRPSSISVVDFGGNLRGALRPDKGRIANILIAEKKAWTAVAFQRPTDMVRDVMLPGAFGYGLQHTDERICMVGGGFRAAAQHSQMLTPLFTHIPGLKVVCPSNAYDAKGLLIQSIRDNDPVIFCEHKNLYTHAVDVPAESYTIPFGEAVISREGKSATIVTYGLMVHRALEAAETLAKEKIDVEVIDLRTLSPIDIDTVVESVEKTGRLVAVDEANPRCSIASDVIASVMEHAFKAMKSAPRAVTAPHTPVPFSPTLEDLYIPSAAAIAEAVRGTMK